MSAIGTYKYGLAKSLVPALQSLTSNRYTVDSSFSFVKETTNTSLPCSTVMVSCEVSRLLLIFLSMRQLMLFWIISLVKLVSLASMLVLLIGLVLRNFLNLLLKIITSSLIISCMNRLML